MTQAERRLYLIRSLLNEKTEYQSLNVPRDAGEQRKLLRSLMNVRMPKVADEAFLRVQDEYLQQELADEGVTDLDDLRPVSGDLYLWQGDITRLKCGAIVNAANSGMTGCYIPCHACIDNCIHTFAGVQLRQDCAALMAEQGHEEQTGQAKITKAYNLPCDYVLHTVGPIVSRDKRGRAAACVMLPILSGTCGEKQCAKHRVLLHFDRCVPFSKRARGGDRRGDRAAL